MPFCNITSSFAEPSPEPRPVQPPAVPDVPDLSPYLGQSGDIQYELISGATQRGGDLLCDSYGYSYTKKSGRNFWRCTVRAKSNTCKGTVHQCDGTYTRGPINHSHPGNPGIAEKDKVTKKVHQITSRNVFKYAAAIVEEVMASDLQLQMPAASRPKLANLVRSSNWQQKRKRPADPTDLQFSIDSSYLPDDFFKGDVKVGEEGRHLIFATTHQLTLLSKTTAIYLDGTFRVVNKPFHQLFSFHAFISDESGKNVKQVPLCFSLMSKRHERDYQAVFHAVRNLAPNLQVVTNYARETWITGQFPPETWCVYQRIVRTNNDVEGWHNRLNTKPERGNLPIYLLVQLLHVEASLIPLTQQLIAEDKLRKYQRHQTKALQGHLSKLWEQYRGGEVTTSHLLKAVSRIAAPSTE